MASEPRTAGAKTPPGKKARKKPSSFATHADRRFSKAVREADLLIAAIPEAELDAAMGAAAAAQVPSRADRLGIVRDAILAKGGPDGGRTSRASRSWRLLKAEAKRLSLPRSGLPASAVLVANLARRARAEAATKSSSTAGGVTVAPAVIEGFEFLADVLGLPIETKSTIVTATAAPVGPRVSRARKQSGSLPIPVYCQFETVAAWPDGKGDTLRTLARAILAASLTNAIRLNDALNAVLFADERTPATVIRGSTSVASKDGLPLQLYAPAEGFLGAFWWYPALLAQLGGRRHAVPAFSSTPVWRPSAPGARLEGGVASPRQARDAFRDVLRQEPLCMTDDEFNALAITTHSPHGSHPDMARVLGAAGEPFTESDARALGHWLRDKNAPQPDPRMVPGAPSRTARDGAPVARGGMSFRYTTGKGRRGERDEQLLVRARLVAAVRARLARVRGGWTSLPRDLDSWDILTGTCES